MNVNFGSKELTEARTRNVAEFKRYWVSWYDDANGGFEYNGPWWISGWKQGPSGEWDVPSICAAVLATSEAHAKEIIVSTYDDPDRDIEWRFCNERDGDWSPFGSRFERAAWMVWPND